MRPIGPIGPIFRLRRDEKSQSTGPAKRQTPPALTEFSSGFIVFHNGCF
jgi:hypothetical protein